MAIRTVGAVLHIAMALPMETFYKAQCHFEESIATGFSPFFRIHVEALIITHLIKMVDHRPVQGTLNH